MYEGYIPEPRQFWYSIISEIIQEYIYFNHHSTARVTYYSTMTDGKCSWNCSSVQKLIDPLEESARWTNIIWIIHIHVGTYEFYIFWLCDSHSSFWEMMVTARNGRRCSRSGIHVVKVPFFYLITMILYCEFQCFYIFKWVISQFRSRIWTSFK